MLGYILIGISLALTTSGQLLQKSAAVRAAADTRSIHFIIKILYYRQTYYAVFCLAAGTVCWLSVLYRMEVSKVVPFLSLGFVLVTLASKFRFGETVSAQRWSGVLLITLGLWLVSLT